MWRESIKISNLFLLPLFLQSSLLFNTMTMSFHSFSLGLDKWCSEPHPIFLFWLLWLLYIKGASVYKCFFSHLEQLETSIVGPSQFLPPQRGAGLSHDLERHKQELTPSTPSSLLQGCHGAQGPKLPLVVWFRSWKTTISRGENEVSLVNINQV